MNNRKDSRLGYTVVELMVTIVIVAVLAATVGTFLVKLLTVQEKDREEAYIREKLADVCGAYADAMSIGSSFGTRTRTNLFDHAIMDVKINYRHEAGGVSFETGVVTRVARVISSINEMASPGNNTTNRTVEFKADGFEQGDFVRRLMRSANGDASLIPLLGNMVSCTIRPLNSIGDGGFDGDGFKTNSTALGYLEVKAEYKVKDATGKTVWKNVTVGRVVRLWNRE